ncbi:MAG: hypothetical protein ACC707_17010 [Thiohalomonadales bacterium]
MMVANKIILAFMLTLFFSIELMASENLKAMTPLQKQIVDLSRSKMTVAFDALDRQIELCQNRSYQNVLSPTFFNSVKMSLDEWKILLLHSSSTALHLCEGDKFWGNAIISLKRFLLAEKKYVGKNTIVTRYKQNELCCLVWEREFSLELKYMAIAAETRKKVESLPELRRPFDFMKAINDLESWTL